MAATVISAATKTAAVAKKFLVSSLGVEIEAKYGVEKFESEFGALMKIMVGVINDVNAGKDVVTSSLAEVVGGDYYGDIFGDEAMKALAAEMLEFEKRMQTRTADNFYD